MAAGNFALNGFFGAIFVSLVIWAIFSDVSRLTIPNWVTLGLISGFFPYALIVAHDMPVFEHSAVAFTVFVVGSVFFFYNWFGGGDVKFLAAVALWAGPAGIVSLLLIMSLVGLALGVAILCARVILAHVALPGIAERLVPGWARGGPCPYGVAIGLAALLVVPARLF